MIRLLFVLYFTYIIPVNINMTLTKKALFSILLTSLLTGCSVPGSHLSLDGKRVIESKNSNISNRVNIYPLTAQSVGEFKTNHIMAQTNPSLDNELSNYRYYIGPGDILNITIWDHPELTIPAGSYRSASESGSWVHADGTIFYPYIGKVNVVGKTVTQVRSDIAYRLSSFIEKPQVDVSIASFQSQKTYITGGIKNPGQQPITNIPLTLLDAINKAGGLSDNSDWRNVTLTRNGKDETVSLYALIQRGDLTQNRLLRSGDIIHVPRDDAQKVFVMGEVKEPKLLKIDRAGMSLTEALSSVGGINEIEADATGIFVIRATKAGFGKDNINAPMVDLFQLNAKDATALVIGTEFDLRPYDIVYVTAAPIVRWNRVISQLLPTINSINLISETRSNFRDW
ncbi:Polysialic acid transport protein KpsD precursor [Photobacterium malacitanum]|uniref:Polysialic acid transport protein KpsD n=2 Tax=Vibrionaceae TaxID=641 RepID=A0A1Y6MQV3_9GAMM|nr:Polysialic acid transport protein KpsD precursor [Photobacterium malacitanum]